MVYMTMKLMLIYLNNNIIIWNISMPTLSFLIQFRSLKMSALDFLQLRRLAILSKEISGFGIEKLKSTIKFAFK